VKNRENRAAHLYCALINILLQEGRDLPAAEQALRDILALDPENAEAQHNLSILHGKQQLPVTV
jgi:hypothetical protein